jgi:hypothetical protein
MACLFRTILVFLIAPIIVSGCISLRIDKLNIGNAVPGPVEQLKENQSTLQDALKVCGAPFEVIDLEGRIVLVYEKEFYKGADLSFGIPVTGSLTGAGPNLGGYGSLWKYDRLALFFSPDWVLRSKVYAKGSEDPFFKTLFRDKGSGK